MYIRSFIAAIACIAAFGCNAQSDTTVHRHRRHELGLEMTRFVRQFFYNPGANEFGGDFYTPTYMFSYRYHLRRSNLRFGIGVDASDVERPATWFNSLPGETYHVRSSSISVRLGWERVQEITRKWQVFYGVDLRPAWVNNQSDWDYSNGGYRFSLQSTEEHWAVAPVAGVRFRISPRFSILTESSFAFDRVVSTSRRSATSQAPEYPPIDDETTKTTSTATVFQAPLMVIAAFDL